MDTTLGSTTAEVGCSKEHLEAQPQKRCRTTTARKQAWPLAPPLPGSIRSLVNGAAWSGKRVATVQRLQLAKPGERVATLPAPVEVLQCNTNSLRREVKEALEALMIQVFCDQCNWWRNTKDLLNSQSGTAVLVVTRGSVVAAALVECSAAALECTVRMMATYPRERRRGFGRLLDCYVHLFAARCGMKRVCVEVSQRDDGAHHNVRSFWMQSAGYVQMSHGERSSAPCHACIFKGTELLARPVHAQTIAVRNAREAMERLRARALS